MNNETKLTNTRLQKLSGSDFEMMDGDPDIKGWDVKESNGRNIGEVEDLLFDIQSRKIRYLVLDLDFDEIDIDIEDRKVLVPVGVATLHKDEDEVILSGVSIDQLRVSPEYDEDNFDLEVENNMRNVYGNSGTNERPLANDRDIDDYYNEDYFDDTRLYRNRRSNL